MGTNFVSIWGLICVGAVVWPTVFGCGLPLLVLFDHGFVPLVELLIAIVGLRKFCLFLLTLLEYLRFFISAITPFIHLENAFDTRVGNFLFLAALA